MPLTLCIAIFIIIFFMNKDFNIRYMYNYAIVAGFLGLSFLVDGVLKINRNTWPYLFMAVVVVAYSFMPGAVRDANTTNSAISIVLFTICCLMADPSDREINLTLKVLVVWAIIISFYLLMVKAVPSVYWNMIYPHLSSVAQGEAVYLMRDNSYGVAMGGSAVYVEYVGAIGAFICLGRILGRGLTRKKEYMYFGLVFLFILTMLIQNRRSELLAALAALFLMVLLNINFGRIIARRVKQVLGIACVGVAGLALMLSRGMLDRYVQMFIGLASNDAGGIVEVGNGRVALWNLALELFKSSPVFGIGWRQYSAHNFVSGMEGVNVHNDYLQWLCETGIVGFILIAVPMFYLWIKTIKWCRKLRGKGDIYGTEVKAYAYVSCGIQTFQVIMHLMDPCFYKLLYWAMFSLAIVLYNMSRERAYERNT